MKIENYAEGASEIMVEGISLLDASNSFAKGAEETPTDKYDQQNVDSLVERADSGFESIIRYAKTFEAYRARKGYDAFECDRGTIEDYAKREIARAKVRVLIIVGCLPKGDHMLFSNFTNKLRGEGSYERVKNLSPAEILKLWDKFLKFKEAKEKLNNFNLPDVETIEDELQTVRERVAKLELELSEARAAVEAQQPLINAKKAAEKNFMISLDPASTWKYND